MRVVHECQDSGLFGAIAPFLLRLVQRLVGGPDEIGRGGHPTGDGARKAQTDGDGIAVRMFHLRFTDFAPERIGDPVSYTHLTLPTNREV